MTLEEIDKLSPTKQVQQWDAADWKQYIDWSEACLGSKEWLERNEQVKRRLHIGQNERSGKESNA